MRSSVAIAFLCIVFGPFGVLCIAWTFIFLARGEYLSSAIALGFAVFALGLIAMLIVVASRRVTPRIRHDDHGVMLRPDQKVDSLLMASTFGVFLAMALYAIFAPLDMLDIPVPRSDDRYFVFTCAAGVLVGIPSLWQILKQHGMSHLRMTPDGLVVGNATTSKGRSWDEVTDVADRPRNGRHPSGTTYIATADGGTRTLVSDWYTPGGHALREFVRFYWRHPEHREELADGRAVQRLETEMRGAA